MLKEIIEEYKNGIISNKEYCEKIFLIHEILLEYPELLKNSLVKNINITKDGVIVEIESNDNIIKMKVYSLDSCAVPVTIMNIGEYEKNELDISLNILKMIGDTSVIFDVGANLGWYTLNMAKTIKNSKIYSFEPIQETFEKLKTNLLLNNISDKNIYNFGFYSENKVLEFFYDIFASGASSIQDLRELDTTKIVKCNVKKLDDFVIENGINNLDFIKCDVEGAELFVYKGGLESIKKFKPVIFSEMLRKWSAKFGYHPNEIIDLFGDVGYKCFVISNRRLKEFERVDEETIETNYFFLHPDKHRDIINKMSNNII